MDPTPDQPANTPPETPSDSNAIPTITAEDIAPTASESQTPSVTPASLAPSVAVPEAPDPAMSDSQPTAPVAPPQTGVASKRGGSKKRLTILVAAIVLLLILLGGGYVLAVYLPSQSTNVYNAGLKNSAQAQDDLIKYLEQQDTAKTQSVSFDGTVKESGDLSYDVSLSGKFSKTGNGDVTAAADIEGQKVTLNLRSIKAAGNTSPDIYFQLMGIKPLLEDEGLSTLDSLDGQWLVIDHTLLDSWTNIATKDMTGTSGSTASAGLSAPTVAELNDALNRAATINTQYLFATDKAHAVLTRMSYVGKETRGGRIQYHYKVGYNKSNVDAYLTALQSSLNASSLNSWAKKINPTKDLGNDLGLENLEKTLNTVGAGYTFDLWVDAKTKLVSAVQFNDPTDSSVTYTLAQGYIGGTQYPFTLGYSSHSGTTTENDSLNITLDTASHRYQITSTLATTDKSAGNSTSTESFSLIPSTNNVTETAPSGAISINNILSELGTQGVLGDSTSKSQPTTTPSPPLSVSAIKDFLEQ